MIWCIVHWIWIFQFWLEISKWHKMHIFSKFKICSYIFFMSYFGICHQIDQIIKLSWLKLMILLQKFDLLAKKSPHTCEKKFFFTIEQQCQNNSYQCSLGPNMKPYGAVAVTIQMFMGVFFSKYCIFWETQAKKQKKHLTFHQHNHHHHFQQCNQS